MSNEEPIRYTVMELSALLEVKRTTVNDWLTKYAMYIESSIQGKRKTYTERSLEVLRTIHKLREEGLSSFEIEAKLSELFAIHPVASTPETPQQQEEKKETAEQLPERVTPEAIIARKDAAELLHQFQAMMEKIDRLEAAAAALPPPAPPQEVKPNWLLWSLFALCAVILIAGGAFAYVELQNMKTLAGEQAQTNEQLQKNIADQSLQLTRSQEDVKRLGDEIRAADQRLIDTKQAFDRESKAQAALHKAESEKLNLQLKNEKLAAEKALAESKALELEKAHALAKANAAEKAKADALKAEANALKAKADAEKKALELEKKIRDTEKAKAVPKVEPKEEIKPEPKVEVKPVLKPEVKPEPKVETKPAK